MPNIEIEFADEVALELAAYEEKVDKELQNHLEDSKYKLRREIFDLIPHTVPLDQGSSADLLKKLMGAIERRIKAVCSPRSWYFMLYLTRRLPVEQPQYAAETHKIARVVSTLACMKYGNRDIAADFGQISFTDANLPGKSVPRARKEDDHLGAFEVRELALEHALVAALLRSVWKGGQLIITEDWNMTVFPINEQVKRLTEIYDSRPSWAGFSGIASLDSVSGPKEPFALLCAEPMEMGSHRIQRYLPQWFSLKPTYNILSDLYLADATSFKRIVGLRPKDLVAFLVGMAWKEATFLEHHLESWGQLLSAGYVPFITQRDESDFVDWYRKAHAECFGERPGRHKAEDVVALCLRQLTYKDNLFVETMLWDRSPVRIGFYVGDRLFWDFTVTYAMLDSLLHPLARERDKLGAAKGHAFERILADFLRKQRFNVAYVNRELKAGGDLDVGVIHNRLLFAIQCKCRTLNVGLMRGEPDAVRSRAECWKSDVDEHIQFCSQKIAVNPPDLQIPGTVTHVIAICCNPFKEFYPASFDPEQFIGINIPIVATPPEIAEFIKGFSLADHQGKSYVEKIKRD